MPSSFKYWAVDVMMMDRRTAFSCAMHASQRLCAEKKPRVGVAFLPCWSMVDLAPTTL